jgi:raffinose/stachyose/melibiose transport system permease protein
LALFLLPALGFYAFAVLIPSTQGAAYAFTDWDGLSPTKAFVGFDQFALIRHDPAARDAVGNTLFLAVAITIGQNLVGLLLALGVYSQIKSRNFLRVLLFAPVVVLPVAAAYLWQYLLAPTGAINLALDAIGLDGLQQDWLGNPELVLWSVTAVIIWQFAGFSMVIFLAGLVTIPNEVVEAAHVDGAGYMRRLWFIVLPLLAPAITINLLLTTIGGLKLFDQVFVMTHGGPGSASETISTTIYREGVTYGRFAYASAMAVVLTLFVAVVSFAQYKLLTRRTRFA